MIGARLVLRLTDLHPPVVGRHHQLGLEVLEDLPEVDGLEAGRGGVEVLGVEAPNLPSLQQSHHQELS